jgi:hypothetical protein
LLQFRNNLVLFRDRPSRDGSRMLGDSTIRGTSVRSGDPEWRPLLDLIGSRLAEWFMWMFDHVLADGARVHAYKHVATRRYLHLAEDGRAFVYEGDGRYREIQPRHAIHLAFAGWESLSPEPGDLLAHAALLRLVSDRAARRTELLDDDA